MTRRRVATGRVSAALAGADAGEGPTPRHKARYPERDGTLLAVARSTG